MKNMTRLFLFMTLASVGMVHTGYAADATSFNPLAVSVEAQAISGVPVGTIITWPVAGNPEGWAEGNWLECNGQTISPTVYPELCALIGGQVPDLRGLFLRGTGGNAAALGTVQYDAGRNITGNITVDDTQAAAEYAFNGAFGVTGIRTGNDVPSGWVNGLNGAQIGFDASRIWGSEHTALEFRPVNRAVRYLMRARS